MHNNQIIKRMVHPKLLPIIECLRMRTHHRCNSNDDLFISWRKTGSFATIPTNSDIHPSNHIVWLAF